jgi:hypothetical protein
MIQEHLCDTSVIVKWIFYWIYEHGADVLTDGPTTYRPNEQCGLAEGTYELHVYELEFTTRPHNHSTIHSYRWFAHTLNDIRTGECTSAT